MRTAKALSVWALAVACLGAATELYAQIPTDRTYLEFTSPARIPGAALAPGMYLFVIGPPVGDQAIIDVYSADGSRLVASSLAIESRLQRPARQTLLDFRAPGPATLRAWFHPSNMAGYEFVYSPQEAREIFEATGQLAPYAAFPLSDRNLVGAIPIRYVTPLPVIRLANAGAVAPGYGTAILEPFDTLGPHEHLLAARRVASTAAQSQPDFKALLELIERSVAQLQAAYRRDDRKAMEQHRLLIERTLENLMPDEAEIAAHRQMRLPRDVVLALERVAAHVRAAMLADSARRASR